VRDSLAEIVQTVKTVLRETPPELSADIMDKGMVLAGGSSLLANLPEFVSNAIGVPCTLAEDALLCVARGTGAVLENLDFYKKSIMAKK
jgi:rod shape-determining protein MreB